MLKHFIVLIMSMMSASLFLYTDNGLRISRFRHHVSLSASSFDSESFWYGIDYWNTVIWPYTLQLQVQFSWFWVQANWRGLKFGPIGTLCATLCVRIRFDNQTTHQTKIGSCLSDVTDLISCVVQSGGIEPIMFLIYIKELAFLLEQHNTKVKLLADDVETYVRILDGIDVRRLIRCRCSLVWNLATVFISINKCCLERRRFHTYLFWCYKIVFSLVHRNVDKFFLIEPVS